MRQGLTPCPLPFIMTILWTIYIGITPVYHRSPSQQTPATSDGSKMAMLSTLGDYNSATFGHVKTICADRIE